MKTLTYFIQYQRRVLTPKLYLFTNRNKIAPKLMHMHLINSNWRTSILPFHKQGNIAGFSLMHFEILILTIELLHFFCGQKYNLIII